MISISLLDRLPYSIYHILTMAHMVQQVATIVSKVNVSAPLWIGVLFEQEIASRVTGRRKWLHILCKNAWFIMSTRDKPLCCGSSLINRWSIRAPHPIGISGKKIRGSCTVNPQTTPEITMLMGGRNHPHMVYLFKQVRVYHIGFGILGTPKHPIKSQHLALHLFDAGLRFWDAAPAVSGWVSRKWTLRRCHAKRVDDAKPRRMDASYLEQNGRQFSHQGSWVDKLGRQSDILRYNTGHMGLECLRLWKEDSGSFLTSGPWVFLVFFYIFFQCSIHFLLLTQSSCWSRNPQSGKAARDTGLSGTGWSQPRVQWGKKS